VKQLRLLWVCCIQAKRIHIQDAVVKDLQSILFLDSVLRVWNVSQRKKNYSYHLLIWVCTKTRFEGEISVGFFSRGTIMCDCECNFLFLKHFYQSLIFICQPESCFSLFSCYNCKAVFWNCCSPACNFQLPAGTIVGTGLSLFKAFDMIVLTRTLVHILTTFEMCETNTNWKTFWGQVTEHTNSLCYGFRLSFVELTKSVNLVYSELSNDFIVDIKISNI